MLWQHCACSKMAPQSPRPSSAWAPSPPSTLLCGDGLCWALVPAVSPVLLP